MTSTASLASSSAEDIMSHTSSENDIGDNNMDTPHQQNNNRQTQSLSAMATSSSPMAASLSAKKRRAFLALALPFVLVISFRLVNNDFLTLPENGSSKHPQRKRVVDVNAPPVDLPEGETVEHMTAVRNSQDPQQQPSKTNNFSFLNYAPTASSSSRSASLRMEDQPLPVVIDRGEKIPTGVLGSKRIKAADALMCRDNVINYVINATNGKDECQGLQKAFDETCSRDDEEEEEDNTPGHPAADGGSSSDHANEDIWLGQRRTRRRLLTRQRQWRRRNIWKMTQDIDSWDALAEEVYKCIQAVMEWLHWSYQPKFYAQDAVYDVYSDARSQLIHQRKRQRQKQWRRQRRLIEGDLLMQEHATGNLSSSPPPTTTTALYPTNQTAVAKPKPASKPHNYLSVPTGKQHLSEKTLEETLLLQQEDKVMSNLKKAANDTNTTTTTTTTTTNANAANEAQANALEETTEVVSNVLNDPSSIEARACCASILNVYHENCNVDAEEEISDKRLFIVVLIMAFCGMVKSLIRHFKIRWLPEAAGCILVGVMSGYTASFFPHQDFSFDGNWFLRILVPPIVFEAALSIDKKAFHRHLVPIIIYSTAGTLLATFLTASIVFYGTKWCGYFCEPIPYIESLIFGALISSIDPIAVLSVLSNMGMNDTDTLYVLVFGESLLNDGVAIVLFQTLIQFLDASVVVDDDAIMAAVIHFVVVAVGSVLIGVGSGMMCTLYYWTMHGCQTPLVEVLMFLCWSVLPYYVCDGIGWSGIVSAVTVGFVMDMYVIGVGDRADDESEHSHGEPQEAEFFEEEDRSKARQIFSGEGHLSAEARTHIGFVTEIVATMMETAIFAYLGLFLFSHRYHWSAWHVFFAIFACCLSRATMIPVLSALANWVTSMQKYQNRCRGIHKNSPATGVIVDRKMQMVLWFAGLRGAMSFALVEHIPLYDAVSGEGTRFKAELKAMTSASIMFTVFVLGGLTSYFMEHIGLAPNSGLAKKSLTDVEMVALMKDESEQEDINGNGSYSGTNGRIMDTSNSKSRKRFTRMKREDSERKT